MTLQIWIAVLGVVIAGVLIGRRAADMPATDTGGGALWADGVQMFAAAIAFAEGYGASPDNAPTRANNPGDLKLPHLPTTGAEGVSVFPSIESGWSALTHQLTLIATGQSHIYTPFMTVRELAGHWTDTDADAWAANVVSYLQTHGYPSVTVETPVSTVLS